MDWIRENKFLTGFFAAVLVGALVLGYLLYSALGSHAEVSEKYTQQADELRRLQSSVPYPDEANLKKFRDQKQAITQATATLQQSLNAMQLPLEPMTPTEFQDRLRKSVTAIRDKAKAGNIALGPKDRPDAASSFYMGFDAYQASLPKPETAPLLGRQLQGIEMVLNTLIESRVDSINSIARAPVPGEDLPTGALGALALPTPEASEAVAPGAKRPGAKPGGSPAPRLVEKLPFEVAFSAEQARFRNSLNAIAGSKKQFYIIRSMVVKNQRPTAPSKGGTEPAPGALPPEAVPSDATAGASPTPSALQFVLGTEHVDATLLLEIVNFAAPAASPSPGGKPAAK